MERGRGARGIARHRTSCNTAYGREDAVLLQDEVARTREGMAHIARIWYCKSIRRDLARHAIERQGRSLAGVLQTCKTVRECREVGKVWYCKLEVFKREGGQLSYLLQDALTIVTGNLAIIPQDVVCTRCTGMHGYVFGGGDPADFKFRSESSS